jgi:hypothetical protein
MNEETRIEKKSMDRRNFLLGGAAAAAAGLAVFGPKAAFGRDPLPAVGSWPWPAKGLDPVATAGASTEGLSGCAVASFGLIRDRLAAALPGSAWEAVPPQLVAASNGGGPYGSDCGALQGPLLVMNLLGAPLTLRQEFYKWYCGFPFPSTEWDDLYPFKRTIQTVSNSPLCHESRAIWDGLYFREVYDGATYDNTRCAKLPRDCVKKAVELLNSWKAGGHAGAWTPDYNAAACYDCHTQLAKDRMPGALHAGKEDCTRCHKVVTSHGKSSPKKPPR